MMNLDWTHEESLFCSSVYISPFGFPFLFFHLPPDSSLSFSFSLCLSHGRVHKESLVHLVPKGQRWEGGYVFFNLVNIIS